LERPIPEFPFEQVSTDLFNFEDEEYAVLIDNYSDFIEYDRLQNSASSRKMIEKLEMWFTVHVQPQQVYSDNGPQYSSMEFKKFAQECNF
jgi:transposase InsO family protein